MIFRHGIAVASVVGKKDRVARLGQVFGKLQIISSVFLSAVNNLHEPFRIFRFHNGKGQGQTVYDGKINALFPPVVYT